MSGTLTTALKLGAALLASGWLAVAAAEEREGRTPNRLAGEKSPYLLQHAYNPVAWYPWGEEAFEAARRLDRPIFLSIGYSTCHWCHVMERESFEDEDIAEKLNAEFIAIKVDREERPDVDEVYMAAVMATRGSGGWPLSAFLTPDGRPFFLGTYFPPRDDPRRGLGFLTVLQRISDAWRDQRDKVLETAEGIAQHLRSDVGPAPAEAAWTRAQIDAGFRQIASLYDSEYGGFGNPPRFAPKFPRTSLVDCLLAYHALAGDAQALSIARTTLERMAAGGIFDHVGKGFHRYSTDREWLVPHFEKMLYDNALIAITYLDAYRLTRDSHFRQVAVDTLSYLLTRMRSPEGGFFSAEDADSEGEEGKYYVFDRNELDAILGEELAALFASRFGVTDGGNFEHGKSILSIRRSYEELAESRPKTAAELRFALEGARVRVLEARDKRVAPLRDDKVLTDWNAMAISAMAIAAQATGDSKYLEAAREALAFLRQRLMKDGKLLHRYREGEARYPAYFEGYAYLVAALLDVYEATLDLEHLTEAVRLARVMIEQFWDDAKGGFFHTGPEHEELIVRTKEYYDGAIPSGNSVAAGALLRLTAYTGDETFASKAATMRRLGAQLFEQGPERHPKLLHTAVADLLPRVDVVLVGRDVAAARDLAQAVHERYVPNRTLVLSSASTRESARALVPWLADAEPPAADPETPYALVRRGGGAFERVESAATLKERLSLGATASGDAPK